MSARVRRRKAPVEAPTLDLFRMRLSPIQWGKRDPMLARGVCQNIRETMPATVVRFDPFTHSGFRRALRALGIRPDLADIRPDQVRAD